jgi:hypothetical protein
MGLFPLGLLSQGGGAGIVPAYEQIATQVLGSNTSSITFSSIPQTYKHLQLRIVTRSDSGSPDNLTMAFNSDNTASNYRMHLLVADGGSVAAVSQANNGFVAYVASAAQASNIFTAATVDILDYTSTSKNTTVRTLYGTGLNTLYLGLQSMIWFNTAAVTSLTLDQVVGTNFVTGSRFTLYGVKG